MMMTRKVLLMVTLALIASLFSVLAIDNCDKSCHILKRERELKRKLFVDKYNLQNYGKELGKLKENIHKADVEILNSLQVSDNSVKRVSAAKSTAEKMEKQMEDLKVDIASLNKELTSVQHSLLESRREALKSISDEIAAIEKQIDEYKSKPVVNKTVLNRAKMTLQKKRRELLAIEEKVLNENSLSVIGRLLYHVEKLDGKLSAKRSELAAEEKNLSQVNSDSTLRQKLKKIKAEFSQSKIEKLNSDIEHTQKAIESVESAMNEHIESMLQSLKVNESDNVLKRLRNVLNDHTSFFYGFVFKQRRHLCQLDSEPSLNKLWKGFSVSVSRLMGKLTCYRLKEMSVSAEYNKEESSFIKVTSTPRHFVQQIVHLRQVERTEFRVKSNSTTAASTGETEHKVVALEPVLSEHTRVVENFDIVESHLIVTDEIRTQLKQHPFSAKQIIRDYLLNKLNLPTSGFHGALKVTGFPDPSVLTTSTSKRSITSPQVNSLSNDKIEAVTVSTVNTKRRANRSKSSSDSDGETKFVLNI